MIAIRYIFTTALAAALAIQTAPAAEEGGSERAQNMIGLKPFEVENLRIQTVEVDEKDFETTVFAIGRIEEIPANNSVLSSRISGRAIQVNAFVGDHVTKGQVLVEVESRQPGNPPPTISLRASQSGLVIASRLRVGQPVEPAAELLNISDRSEMWAVAKIPEKEASIMAKGTRARITVHALGGEPIIAEITRFGIIADREAGTVQGIFQIPNPDGRLQPGMRAEFAIVTAQRPDVLAVPRTAVQGDPANRVVYVKDFDLDNVFIRAPVVLGELNDGYIEVIKGLLPGDEVVTRGSYSLGFAGAGSISLKEALDAAHGHEHAEDGSELTADQKSAKKNAASGDHDHSGSGKLNTYLLAAVATLLLLGATQILWARRRS